MWGRLDAATRIVQLLIDPRRAVQLHRQHPEYKPWTRLARCLLPDTASADQVWLIRELIGEEAPEDRDALRLVLSDAIQHDLCTAAVKGTWTARVCTRAVQLEILQQELAVLVETSHADRRDGASSAPLSLDLGDRLQDAIEELREAPTLPRRLDARGKGELGSTLGLRTSMHVAFVVLAALRNAKLPFAKPLYLLRAVLFPVAGAVSRIGWYRAVVWGAFWAAALYLTSRLVTTTGPAELREALSRPVLLSYIALLAIVGVVIVPALRVISERSTRRRIGELAWALLLLASGVAVTVTLALTKGNVALAELLVTSHSTAAPPKVLATTIVGLVIVVPLLRLPGGVRSKIRDWLARRRWLGPLTALAFFATCAWLIVWAIAKPLWALLNGDDNAWKSIAAWIAVAGAPLVAGVYLAKAWLRDQASIDQAR